MILIAIFSSILILLNFVEYVLSHIRVQHCRCGRTNEQYFFKFAEYANILCKFSCQFVQVH